MKNRILLKSCLATALALGSWTGIHAQQWLTTGNAAGSSDVLGTTNTQSLNFITNGTANTRMSITGQALGNTVAGSIGVGTTSPGTFGINTLSGKVLHMKHTSHNTMLIEATTGFPGVMCLQSNGSPDAKIGGLRVGSGEVQLTAYDDAFQAKSPLLTANLISGNVGINCSSSLARLEVRSSANQLRITQDIVNGKYTDLQTTSTSNFVIKPVGGFTGINMIPTDLPTEALDVKGRIKMRTMDKDNTLTQILVADATGIFKVRDLSSLALSLGVTASNGLNASGSDVRLGGTLNNSTTIDQQGFPLLFQKNAATTVSLPSDAGKGVLVTSTANGSNFYAFEANVSGTAFVNRGLLAQVSGATQFNSGASIFVNSPSSVVNWGLEIEAKNGTGNNKGANIVAAGGSQSWGIDAVSQDGTFSNTGGSFIASGVATQNVGVYGAGSGATNNYGVVGTVGSGSSPGYAGYFDGPVYQGTIAFPSDLKLKEDVKEIKNVKQILAGIQPKTYKYRVNEFPQFLPKGQQFGLIAQELEKVLPELVMDVKAPGRYDAAGKFIEGMQFKAVNYVGLIPILLQNAKEQQDLMQDLQDINAKQSADIEALKVEISQLKNERVASVPLSFKTSAVLAQNTPNPFNEKTTIAFTIPSEVKEASLIIYNMNGLQIKKVILDQRNNGKVEINAGELSAGMYLYTLIADGQEIDTKRMILTKE